MRRRLVIVIFFRYDARMDNEQPAGRYSVSGNVEAEFVDAAQTILVNRPGITDLETLQIAEEEALASAYESLLAEVRMDTPISCGLIRHAHHCIFAGLYEWAGRWRTLQISKGTTVWPAAQFLDQSMIDFEHTVLAAYPASALDDDGAFCRAAGVIQGEFLAIHPFREGNARTIKLVTNLLAAQTGRPLLIYDSTNTGTDRYIAAAKAAFARKNYEPMTGIIRQALQDSRTH